MSGEEGVSFLTSSKRYTSFDGRFIRFNICVQASSGINLCLYSMVGYLYLSLFMVCRDICVIKLKDIRDYFRKDIDVFVSARPSCSFSFILVDSLCGRGR